MSRICPVCAGAEIEIIDERQNVPVLMNRLYPSRETAIKAARGNIVFVACSSCGFAWNSTFDPSIITYDDAYENDQSHSAAFQEHIAERAQNIVSAIPEADSIDYLEIGSGQGGFLRLVAKQAGHRLKSAQGFDPAWRGKDFDEVNGARVHKVYFNMQTADRLDRSPNAVASRHTIEHIPDPVAFLRTVRGALGHQSRAKIFIETPCISWILSHQAMQDIFYEHCSIFTAVALRHALEISGFAVGQIRHVFGGQYLWAVAEAADTVALTPLPARVVDNAQGDARPRFISHWQAQVKEAHMRGPVAIWGAGAKGVTFAQLIDPKGTLFDHTVDINPSKQGMYLPVSGLPVFAPYRSAERGPKNIFVMNPNYLTEIKATAATAGIDAQFHVID